MRQEESEKNVTHQSGHSNATRNEVKSLNSVSKNEQHTSTVHTNCVVSREFKLVMGQKYKEEEIIV